MGGREARRPRADDRNLGRAGLAAGGRMSFDGEVARIPVALGDELAPQPILGVRPHGLDPVTLRHIALEPRMEMGASMLPRRHASSQGAAQTRPQTEANGLGARATR